LIEICIKMNDKLKLHLGCGEHKFKGWVNCDISSEVNPDMIVNLEKMLPFDDNSVKEVYSSMVLEHIYNLTMLIHELYRVCCNDAKITIRVPFFSSWHNSTDPTHVRTFNHRTLSYFNGSYEVKSNKKMFDIKSEIIFGGGKFGKYINWIFYPLTNHSILSKDIYCRFFAYWIPALEVKYTLNVVK